MGSTRSFVSLQNKYDRVILLVDMDCFYCQVEEKLDPSLAGKPIAVVQYNAWRGGGIIAVNYAARAKGVTRHMRGDEAKEQCPDIVLAKVPNVREKADLTKYREAGKEVAAVLQKYTQLLERASVDEAYLDITDSVNKRLEDMNAGTFVLQPEKLINTYAVGYEAIGEYIDEITRKISSPYQDDDSLYSAHSIDDIPAIRNSDIRLLVGASIASEVRAAVKQVTKYECSAGIAHNKIMAKLACGMNKPNKQTILPLSQLPSYFETLPVSKIKGLGAKFGEEICERLGIKFLGELTRFTEAELQRQFDEKNGTWLYYISRGIDLEAVTPRFYSKSIGCCKKFPGRNMITGLNTLNHWLGELANEISDRIEKDLEENNRRAKQMVVSYIQEFNGEEVSSSRSAPLLNYEKETLTKTSLDVLKANTKQFLRSGSHSILNNPIKFLGISVGKFETISNGQNKLQEMFANQVMKHKRNVNGDKENRETGNSINPKESLPENMKDEQVQPREPDSTKITPVTRDVSSEKPTDSKKQGGSTEAKNSFFLNYFKNQKIEEQRASETNILSASPPEKRSFFLNELKKRKLERESEMQREVKLQSESSKNVDNLESCCDESEQTNSNVANSLSNEKRGFFAKFMTRHMQKSNHSSAEDLSEIETDAQAAPCHGQKRKISESATSLDYQSEYVELAIPEIRNELFVKCDKCGAKVLSDELSLQSHQDRHFAEQLSQQQRDEYREEIKKKINQSTVLTSPNSNKLKKLKKSPVSMKSNNDIKKFLKTKFEQPPETSLPSTSTQAADQQKTILCPECHQYIKDDDMLEHSDFHVAKKLQRSLNQLEIRTVAVVKKPSNEKKKLNTSVPSIKSSSAKPITQFFSQPNS